MLLLLAAIDEGLGAGLFGLFPAAHNELLQGAARHARGRRRRRCRHDRATLRPTTAEARRAGSSRGSRSRRSSAGNAGRRSRRGQDRRDVQPVQPLSSAPRTARGLPRGQAPRVRRPRRRGRRLSRRTRQRPPVHVRAAADGAQGRPRRARRSSTASSPSSGSRTRCCCGTSFRHIHIEPDRPYTNRRPSLDEVESSSLFLEGVVRGRRVVAVGRLAQQATGAAYVRHPSHGGAAAFRAGLERLL